MAIELSITCFYLFNCLMHSNYILLILTGSIKPDSYDSFSLIAEKLLIYFLKLVFLSTSVYTLQYVKTNLLFSMSLPMRLDRIRQVLSLFRFILLLTSSLFFSFRAQTSTSGLFICFVKFRDYLELFARQIL
jgi:hypothetical protein